MNIYHNMNNVINYIEENLQENIEYKKIAQILGVNEYTTKIIFNTICGITITEYIRNRRLSNAALDLCTTDDKIIDISTEYGYDNPTSFSRAFAKFHGIKPSEVRENKNNLKVYPKIEFLEKEIKLNIFCPSNGKKLNTTKSEIGCDGYIDFIKLGIDVFGKYNVRTALIVGLNTNKEIEEAIDYFLKIGCFVVLSPFKTNNKELKHLEPDIDSLIHLGNYLDEKLEDILRFCRKEEKIMYRKRINNSLNAHNTHNTANFCCKKELDSLEKVVS